MEFSQFEIGYDLKCLKSSSFCKAIGVVLADCARANKAKQHAYSNRSSRVAQLVSLKEYLMNQLVYLSREDMIII